MLFHSKKFKESEESSDDYSCHQQSSISCHHPSSIWQKQKKKRKSSPTWKLMEAAGGRLMSQQDGESWISLSHSCQTDWFKPTNKQNTAPTLIWKQGSGVSLIAVDDGGNVMCSKLRHGEVDGRRVADINRREGARSSFMNASPPFIYLFFFTQHLCLASGHIYVTETWRELENIPAV